ncbi:MAG TPA: RNA polymerase subunit sigma-70 [Planctomycetaceae bacterium]|nr:RNA polymerase subunit sigma-70 [Planctomycetaceae bacterium]
MLRVQDGDEEAFGELVESFRERLIHIFSHLVGGQDAAEDLAQEVFLRIYRARESYRPTAKFSTWLFRIANNLAYNARRTLGRRKEVTISADDSGPLGPRPAEQLLADQSSLLPSRQFVTREMRDQVQEAIESLNDRQRLAVLLHKFEGMSYADIGLSMDLTPQAVKSLLSRARENLKLHLKKYVAN